MLFFCIQETWNTNITLVLHMILSENFLNKDCSCKAKVLWHIIFQPKTSCLKNRKHNFLVHHLTIFKNNADDFSFIEFLTSWFSFLLVYLLIAFSLCVCFPFPLLHSFIFPVPIWWSSVQLLFDLGLCHLAPLPSFHYLHLDRKEQADWSIYSALDSLTFSSLFFLRLSILLNSSFCIFFTFFLFCFCFSEANSFFLFWLSCFFFSVSRCSK